MAIKEYSVDLDIKGRVLATDVPNSTGSIVTWNANTNVFGLRTNSQIISDLNLSSNYWTTNSAQTGLTGNKTTSGIITSSGGFVGALTGNASTATRLATARTINGTSFNGSANITTARWGTARNITIGDTTKSVNGSSNVSWSLSEIGAASTISLSDYVPYTGANQAVNLNTQSLTIGGDFEKIDTTFEKSYLTSSTTNALHFTRLTDVASFSRGNDTTTQSDCIVITLPIRSSTRWVMEVDIFARSSSTIFSGTPTKLVISAYNTTNSATSVTAISNADNVKSVSFCRDTNNNTVIIIRPKDDAVTVFTYGKVNIANFYHSVTYNSDLADKSNYSVDVVLESDLTGLTTNGTITNAEFTRDSYLWNKGDFTQTNVDNWNEAWTKNIIQYDYGDFDFDTHLDGAIGSVNSNNSSSNPPEGGRFMSKFERLNGSNGFQWGYNINQLADTRSSVFFRKYRGGNFGDWNRIWTDQDFNIEDLATETYVDTEIDNIEIGGRNLFPNSISPLPGSSGGLSPVKITDVLTPIGVKDIYKLTKSPSHNGLMRYRGLINNDVDYGRTFTFSFWVRTVNSEDTLNIQTDINDNSNHNQPPPITNTWTRVIVTSLNLKTSASNDFVDIYVTTNDVPFYICGLKLEVGNKATDWTPAPEDQVTDWNETNPDSFSFLKNKPTDLLHTADLNGYATETWADDKFLLNTTDTLDGELTVRGSTQQGDETLLKLSKNSPGYGYSEFVQKYSNEFYPNGKTLDINIQQYRYLSLANVNNADSGKIVAHKPIEYNGGNSDQWNTAFGWGDHSTEGYLTSETDPIFTASPAAGISNTDITNWDAKGVQLTADQPNAKIHLKDIAGNILSTLDVGFLNNEGTTISFNSTTDEIELRNDDGDLLSSFPASALMTGVGFGLNLTGSTLELLDSANNTIDSVTLTIANIQGLQTALDGKALKTTHITAGIGLAGGGSLAVNRTISLDGNTQAYLNRGNIAYGWGDHSQEGYATETWALNTFIEDAPKDGKQYARKDANWSEVAIPDPIDLSTGLEAIDEGNGIGWRLKGANPDNYGNIGKGAIDLGESNNPSTTVGATGGNSTVSGGRENTASIDLSTVGGGGGNTASGEVSTVGGGVDNTASGSLSTVGGGNGNRANGELSTVGGGARNDASGDGATVGGGNGNIASSDISTVGGGGDNTAIGNYSTVGGGTRNEASNRGSTVGGGYQNIASSVNSTVGGGGGNTASGSESTVGGGINNTASGVQSTVGGGAKNEASGSQSTVGGGGGNTASGASSTVLGGEQNLAKTFGEVLGGLFATIKEGDATSWIGKDRIFGIGNGKSDSERSDAFNIYKNGVAELPSVTNSLIDSAGAKTIPTKEWANSNFDNYQSWNLKTNGTQRTTIQSGGSLDLVAGNNTTLQYGAGGKVTINSSFNNTTYTAGTGLGLTGTTFSFDTAWGDGRYSLTGHTHTFASLTSKPTTISGYGITDFNSLGDARWALRTRTITGTGSLTGGGNLTANRTLDLTTTAKSDIANGVTAHGWGDHSQEGYATETYVDTEIDNIEIGGRNLIIQKDLNLGYLRDDGGISGGTWRFTDYISVEPNETFIVSGFTNLGSNPSTIFYDSDFNQVDFYKNRSGNNGTYKFSIPNNSSIEYMRFSFTFADIDSIKLEKGNKTTDWTPAPEDQVTDWDETNPESFSYLKNKPTKLSDFTNDGFATETWALNTFIEDAPSDGKQYARKDANWSEVDIPDPIDLSTGLEAIDEGNGIGWRLKGRNPDNYGDIGRGAIDLGSSDLPSTTVGATGPYSSVGGGVDNIASGGGSTVSGGQNNEATSNHSTVGGGFQNEASGSQSTVSGGYNNKASSSYSTAGGGYQNEATGSQSTVSGGLENTASGDYSTVSGGVSNIAKTLGEFLGGLWSTIKEGNASSWIGTDRIFGVGNGESESQRSDAFNVYKNGVAELPSVNNSLIDAAGSKTIPTKEWINSNFDDYRRWLIKVNNDPALSVGSGDTISIIEDDGINITRDSGDILIGLSSPMPTKTSDLVNDGEGTNPFISHVDMYLGNTLIMYDYYNIPGTFSYQVWVDKYIFDNVYYDHHIEGVVTLPAAHATLRRIDVIVFNSDETFSVVTGTPSANPSEPVIDIETQLKVTVVLVEAGATEPDPGTTPSMIIYDENLGWSGDEANATTSNSSRTDFNHPDAYRGNKAIKVSGEGLAQHQVIALTFTLEEVFNGGDYDNLFIHRKHSRINHSKGTMVRFVDNFNSPINQVHIDDFGYDPQLFNEWQRVRIPLDFLSGTDEVKKIQILMPVADSLEDNHFDFIFLQGGTGGSSGTREHNELRGLQGGGSRTAVDPGGGGSVSHKEYYHLTKYNYEKVGNIRGYATTTYIETNTCREHKRDVNSTRYIINTPHVEFCVITTQALKDTEIEIINYQNTEVDVSTSSSKIYSKPLTGVDVPMTKIQPKTWMKVIVQVYDGTPYFLIVNYGEIPTITIQA